ncbi:hypothetical protein NMY22_g9375 [Coprinellus aureogranulatus]|nr:hypothetical protein NMY22_g9375 [Coprinellus aureogranulatus]
MHRQPRDTPSSEALSPTTQRKNQVPYPEAACRCAPQEMGRLAELHIYASSEEDAKMPKPLEAYHQLIVVLQAIMMWLSSTLAATTRRKFSGETGNSDG